MNGVQGVEGSNPFIPTRNCKGRGARRGPFLVPARGPAPGQRAGKYRFCRAVMGFRHVGGGKRRCTPNPVPPRASGKTRPRPGSSPKSPCRRLRGNPGETGPFCCQVSRNAQELCNFRDAFIGFKDSVFEGDFLPVSRFSSVAPEIFPDRGKSVDSLDFLIDFRRSGIKADIDDPRRFRSR